jgi:hypothetical protein
MKVFDRDLFNIPKLRAEMASVTFFPTVLAEEFDSCKTCVG